MGFVEIGRVAYVSIGPFKHRLVAIVDIINQKSALVDGPGVPRKAMMFKHMRLLKYKSVIARRTRASLNDFERFKLSKAKKARNHEINKAYSALKKAAKA